jgi:oligopeptidase B
MIRQLPKRSVLQILFPLLMLVVVGCSDEQRHGNVVSPPIADVEPTILSQHGHERTDEFYWIRDDSRTDQRVRKLLEDENAYTSAMMAHTAGLQAELVTEISSRLPVSDKTVPVRNGDFLYFREIPEGSEYPVYKRTSADESAAANAPVTLLDVNELARGHTYYRVGNWSVSPDQAYLAFAEDTVGRRQYTIRFKDLKTGEVLGNSIAGVSAALAWSSDGQTLYYVRNNPTTLLPYQVYRHAVAQGEDTLVYEEKEASFFTSVYTSRTQAYVIITSSSTTTTQSLLLDTSHPDANPQAFLPREQGHEYRIRHHDGWFYVLTNWDSSNFRLMKVAEQDIGSKNRWQEVVPHRVDVLLEDFEVFTDHLVIVERHKGLTRVRTTNLSSGDEKFIHFEEAAYVARLHSNPDWSAKRLRYSYASMTTPFSIQEFDLQSGVSTVLKRDEVQGDFDRDSYRSERHFFTARDGTQVPVSLVYRRDMYAKGRNPGYIYAYGAYGFSSDAGFQSRRLSLLDRGFVVAIVHVRGGEEMGRKWYEAGRLLRKRNTFNDFVDGTRDLVARGFVNPAQLFAAGGSAGGLLMGVVINEAPELYLGVVAHVPFVDLLTTMSDDSIPLTAGEYSEWGNPQDKVFYDYMLSYSPYDQVKPQRYPNLLVTTGLHDSQVQYYEPVKWVSRLRRMKQDNNLLLIDINMESGHGGSSGRYERHKRDALEYAFILDLAGKG